MNRAYELRHDIRHDDAVDLTQSEPLGTPGSPDQRTDTIESEPMPLNGVKCCWAGLEDQIACGHCAWGS